MKSRLSAEMVISLPCSQPMQDGWLRAASRRKGCDLADRGLVLSGSNNSDRETLIFHADCGG